MEQIDPINNGQHPMRFKKLAAILATLAIAAVAGPAFATTYTYTVTANGATSGRQGFLVHSSDLRFTVHHGTTDQVWTCSDVTIGGFVHAGTPAPASTRSRRLPARRGTAACSVAPASR